MLRLEDYIARRKKEDKLDEFELERRAENVRASVNYVFEYFNNYLDIREAEDRTALKMERVEKYRRQVEEYEPEIRDWLVGIYSDCGAYANRTIRRALNDSELFLLFNTDEEFRSLSYEVYCKLARRCSYLKGQTEMLFQFIKDHHRIETEASCHSGLPVITEPMAEWIKETLTKYHVNVVNFAENWAMGFWDNEDSWPPTHRRKSQESWRKWEYNYKQAGNLFNLDSLFRRMPRKSFLKDRKQEFEAMIMYFWLREIVADDDGYWQVYLDKVVPVLQGK